MNKVSEPPEWQHLVRPECERHGKMNVFCVDKTFHRGERATFYCIGRGCRALSINNEVCLDCNGTGWLHMDNRAGDEHNRFVIGHLFGMHIERCDGNVCRRFNADDDAELAHRKECGCGWGLPNDDEVYHWIGYPGANNEVSIALRRAGFDFSIHTQDPVTHQIDEIEVVISDRAGDFIQVLDAVYDKMCDARKPEPGVETSYPQFKAFQESVAAVAGAAVPSHRPTQRVHYVGNTGPGFRPGDFGYWSYDTETTGPGLTPGKTISKQFTKRLCEEPKCVACEAGVSIKGEENMNENLKTVLADRAAQLSTPQSTAYSGGFTVSEHTVEELRAAGLEPMFRKNGSIWVDRNASGLAVHRVVILDLAKTRNYSKNEIGREAKLVATADSLVKKMEGAVQMLEGSAMQLLGRLNEMTFQDHPLAQQKQLESARREMLKTLDDCKKLFNPARTSADRDRMGFCLPEQVATGGGYSIEGLEKHADEDVLSGRLHLDGAYNHVMFIKVHEVNGEQQPTNDPHRRYYDLACFNDESMRTVKVQDFPGDYVMVIYPASQ